jgi:hypothetical protein
MPHPRANGPSRNTSTERDIADFHMGDFDPELSRGISLARMVLPEGELTRRFLFSWASLLAGISHLRLPRDSTRRRDLLIKWLDDNYDVLHPFVTLFQLVPEED